VPHAVQSRSRLPRHPCARARHSAPHHLLPAPFAARFVIFARQGPVVDRGDRSDRLRSMCSSLTFGLARRAAPRRPERGWSSRAERNRPAPWRWFVCDPPAARTGGFPCGSCIGPCGIQNAALTASCPAVRSAAGTTAAGFASGAASGAHAGRSRKRTRASALRSAVASARAHLRHIPNATERRAHRRDHPRTEIRTRRPFAKRSYGARPRAQLCANCTGRKLRGMPLLSSLGGTAEPRALLAAPPAQCSVSRVSGSLPR